MRRSPLRSPPRMRGKAEKQVPFLPPYQDHPRVCGEKLKNLVTLGSLTATDRGITPAYAGKRWSSKGIIDRICLLRGITPAYAGKSWLQALATDYLQSLRDHPRVCGEKPCNRPQLHHGRITPAYAGKSGS